MATGTNVGDSSPYSGNTITKKITIPSRPRGSSPSRGGSSGGGSSNNDNKRRAELEAEGYNTVEANSIIQAENITLFA